MNLKYSRFISVSIMPASVRIAQVRNSGFVEKLAKRAVDKNGADAALKDALAGFTLKGSGVLCIIPGDVVTTKNIEIPSTDKNELESILALQAARHTPFNKDEILTGYINLGRPKPNFTRVLLIVVKKETVQDKLAVMKRAGLDIAAVQFVPEGIALFYAAAFRLKKTDKPIGIIDAGAQSTNFIIQSQSALSMARSIPVGTEHFAVDTEASQHFLNEVKASLEAYGLENGDQKPSRFVLTSNHVALAGIDSSLSSLLGVKVDRALYTAYIQADKRVKESLDSEFAEDSALDLIATAVCASKCQADFVPQEIRDQRALLRDGREMFKAGVFIILFLFFIGGALTSKVYFRDAFLKQNLLEKYAGQKIEVKNLESLSAKTRILRQYLTDRDISLESIRELYRIVPKEIYLTNISMDGAGAVSLQGVSDSMSQVFSFVTELESSPLFEGVKTKSTSTRKDRGKDAAVFEIVLQLSMSSRADTSAQTKAMQQEK